MGGGGSRGEGHADGPLPSEGPPGGPSSSSSSQSSRMEPSLPPDLPGLRGRHFTLTAEDSKRIQASSGCCSICTMDVLEGEVALELDCNHVFHASCLLEWLAKQPTCPLCRFEALDITMVVDLLVAKLHNVTDQGLHHHEYLPLLEQMISLARDNRFTIACASSSCCLASLARSHSCSVVRSMVLELFLTFSQRGDLHPLIWEAQEDLLPVVDASLGHERPSLRAASCGLIWNLAAPGPGSVQACSSLGPFLGKLARLVEDSDSLVAHRATRALGFLAQAPERARQLLQEDLSEPMLRRAAHLDPSDHELSHLLQTLSQCMEFAERQEEAALWFEKIFPRLPRWLQGSESVRLGALQITLLLSRFQHPDHMAAWLQLYEDQGALRLLLRRRPAAGDETFVESRAHAIGTVWNLAMNQEWREPLAELVLPGLLDVAGDAGLDAVTRERLVIALWHLSKNRVVAVDPCWVEAAGDLARQVEVLSGEARMHGLQLLENLAQAHGGAVAGKVMPMVWDLSMQEVGEDWKEAVGVFCLFLSLSTVPAAREWLWKSGKAFPCGLEQIFKRMETGAEQHPQAEVEYAKAQLVGTVWNLAMDECASRREALARTLLPLMRNLFQDENTTVAARACTAAFHLTKASPSSARLLRQSLDPDAAVLLPSLLLRLRSEDKQLPLLHALSIAHALVSVDSDASNGEDCTSFKVQLGSGVLKSLSSIGLFASCIDAKGVIVEAEGPCCSADLEGTTARLVCVALCLLVHFSGCCCICSQLMALNLFEEGSALVRLLDPAHEHPAVCEARTHVLGVIWNVAVANNGAFRVTISQLVLGRLLALVRMGEGHPHELREVSKHRLVMALVHLAKDNAVAAMPEWLGSMKALVGLVRYASVKEPDAAYELLGNLLEAHGAPVAQHVAPLLWERIMSEDVAEQADSPAIFLVFIRLSAVQQPAALLQPFGDVSLHLAGALRRLSSSSANSARAAHTFLAGALWNLAMDKTPGWRAALGQSLLPELCREGEPWWSPLKDGNAVIVFRIATFLLHLSSCPLNHEQVQNAIWPALQSGPLPDNSHAQLLHALQNVVNEVHRQHGCCGDQTVALCERIIGLFATKRWASSLAPRNNWPQTTVAEMSLLAQVSSLGGAIRRSLASSALLSTGGVLFEALQLRSPDHWASAACWEHEVRSKVWAVAANLLLVVDGAMRTWLGGLLLSSLVTATAEQLEELEYGECEKLVMALKLCSDASPEVELWSAAYHPVVRLVGKVAHGGHCQALAVGLMLLESAFPKKGWQNGLALARKILAAQSCPPEVRQEVLELFARLAP